MQWWMRPGLTGSPTLAHKLQLFGEKWDVPKAALNDLKALAPSVDEVLHGDADVLVNDLAVPLWRIVVAEHAHGADDFHSRRVRGDDDDALLAIPV